MSLVTFKFSELDNIKDRREQEKSKSEWQKRFAKWGIDTKQQIALEKTVLSDIIAPANDPVKQELSAKLIVEWGDKLGAILEHRGLTTSQIRAIFGEVRQIEAKLKISQLQGTASEIKVWNKLRLLIPKMAYRAKKEGDGVKNLASVFEPAINLVLDGEPEKRLERFERFVNFFEAILAYHRAYGGK